MVPEGHIVAEYRYKGCLIRFADDDYRDLTPEQVQHNIDCANAVASQILRNAAARGVDVEHTRGAGKPEGSQ